MSDQDYALELRRHLLALVEAEDHPIKRRALLGIVASVEKRHGIRVPEENGEQAPPKRMRNLSRVA